MTVWLVSYGWDYEGFDVSSVHLTQKTAQDSADKLKEDKRYDNVKVESFEVKV